MSTCRARDARADISSAIPRVDGPFYLRPPIVLAPIVANLIYLFIKCTYIVSHICFPSGMMENWVP